jgi:hypothetical protein
MWQGGSSMNFDEWVGSLRDLILEDESYLDYYEGRWKVVDRRSTWQQFGARVFDNHLDALRSCAVDVLSEIDPQFELDSQERYAAGVYGKVLQHSGSLREGIAQTVALLGNEGDALKNCSCNKAKLAAILIVRELFENNDWRIWASVNHLLPTIAEGAPGEFLDSIQNALLSDESPFDELFKQEGGGTFGGTYISGLLWALEGLAWSEEYLIRVATLLADFAVRDPGGKWSNRPDNSLVSILLPWYPQTLAPFEKQLACLKAVQHDHPEVAWSVLVRLLPNQHQTTSGTHKPSWFMEVSEDWKPSVTHAEYYEQVAQYADMAVEMACADFEKLTELVGQLDNLPKQAFEKIVSFLASDDVKNLDEKRRTPIWSKLFGFSLKHRRFQDAKWALPIDEIEKLDEITTALMPESPEGRYRRLFTNDDSDLYEENGDWEEQGRLLDEKRQQAVLEIWEGGNLDGVLAFAQIVASPYRVGWAFANVADESAEATMLPDMFRSADKTIQFIDGYVWKKYQSEGSEWLDKLAVDQWSMKQRSQLLIGLPFDKDAWFRASDWLENEEALYWIDVNVNPYHAKEDLSYAIDKLLQFARPIAALVCLYVRLHGGYSLDHARTVAALLAAVSSDEPRDTMNQHYALELIKALQADSNTDPDDLFRVEWAYLSLLDRHGGAKPVLLEQKLASEPDFFCEAIQLIYRPKGTEQPEEVDEGEKAVASNAWRLLHEWKRPPGLRDNGSFTADEFNAWFERVKERCAESGHLEVAMIKVGEVLLYCPEDPDGLWINEEIAKHLNSIDAGDMRDGFQTEVFNSRGVHWVDPSGQPERELAQQWRQKAEMVEAAGYARFGATLRKLADSYDREAERVQADHVSDE